MQIIRKIRSLRKKISELKIEGKTIGFVPTMGALHEGHFSLIRQARKVNDSVAVSIFVNPLQFGQKEDFKKYPRNLKQDASLCRREKVDIIFYPDTKEFYPADYKTYVQVESLSGVLCGKFRPGHFKGVTTVVLKLFNLIEPDIAYFGQKDAQQAVIIRRMAKDLNLEVKIKVMPTVRETDGLAMSSRNVYLSEEERKDALVLYQSLNSAKELIKKGVRDADKIIDSMKKFIRQKKRARVDYVSIVDLDNLEPIKQISGICLIAAAVWIGKTRLIDNIIMNPKIKNG